MDTVVHSGKAVGMSSYEGEIIALEHEGSPTFQAVRRGYELKTDTSRPNETSFTAAGEYAVLKDEPGQLLPAEQWLDIRQTEQSSEEVSSVWWATAEDLRTRAGRGLFSPDHIDLIDATLFREQRVTGAASKLMVASEADLQAVLEEHAVPTNHWRPSEMRHLLNYIKPSDKPVTENVALHRVEDSLWLATAQTMVNVYHQAAGGTRYRLRETSVTYYDDKEQPQRVKPSTMRSSMGETGHLIDGLPERPFDTARRGMREELSIEDDSHILEIISRGSRLRLKENHHRFSGLQAQDHTHYFDSLLNPQNVRPLYTNNEYDASGKRHASITLEWFRAD